MKKILTLAILCFLLSGLLSAVGQVTPSVVVDKQPDPSMRLVPFRTPDGPSGSFSRAVDPGIAAMVAAINEDSLRRTLIEMQQWGSRFLMNDNRKVIANSLADRFRSYGYTDVKLDSFYLIIGFGGVIDSGWQYNVVCTLRGTSAPDEIYAVGGHWDSYCSPNPSGNAPGVNDNGTAVAATFEIARVMKQFNYQPPSTIEFTLYAAEELGLFGSRVMAARAREAGIDIRYMLNMDMISNNPQNLPSVKIYQYLGNEWAGMVAADATQRYTDLTVMVPDNLMASGSDSFPYFLEGFPAAYFEEIDFSPHWHKPSDTLGNCNVPYLRKVTGGAIATLAEQQALPYPQQVRSQSSPASIGLSWKPTANHRVAGYNVYRSEVPDAGFEKITAAPVDDSVYTDVPAQLNRRFYYRVTTVNDSLQESPFSAAVKGIRFNFCDTVLVVASVKGEKQTPDSIRNFYEAILDTIPYRWIDDNATDKVTLEHLSRYRNIFWMVNSLEFEPVTEELVQSLPDFAGNGGNLLFTGFYPARYWIGGSIPYPVFVPETFFFRNLFKVDSLDRKMQCMMYRANAVSPGYDTLDIDSSKFMDKNYPGQIFNIEVYHADPQGTVIYRLDSKFDSTTSLGKMKHRPVGVEYMGEDFKSVLLSFPLWYLDTADARGFLHEVLLNKFATPTAISERRDKDPLLLNVYPNPAGYDCHIAYWSEPGGPALLDIFDRMGRIVRTLRIDHGVAGYSVIRLSVEDMEPGFYGVTLRQGSTLRSGKLIITR